MTLLQIIPANYPSTPLQAVPGPDLSFPSTLGLVDLPKLLDSLDGLYYTRPVAF